MYSGVMHTERIPHSLAVVALTVGCGPDIKGDPLSDSGDTAPVAVDTADSGDDDTDDDTDDTSPPPTGDVEVEYTVTWVTDEGSVELCAGTLSLSDVDTSHRTWTVWTDAGLDLDPDNLPNSAPQSTPVGDGNTVNPGSWRFSVDQATDTDLEGYDAALAAGAAPVCLLANGNDLALKQVAVPDPVPPRSGPITEVGIRVTVLWTDR